MKKAYNVYSILGKTVSKAAMLTSVFALCFLFSGQMFSQSAVVSPKTSVNQNLQTDYEVHHGVAVPYTALQNNQDRLDKELIKPENALPVAKDLFNSHNAANNPNANASQEMEHELRRVFLMTLGNRLKQEMTFNNSFSAALRAMSEQMGRYDASLYSGPSLNAIAEGYIVNFY